MKRLWHWLFGCEWGPWSKPYDGFRVYLCGGREIGKQATQLQSRVCLICGKCTVRECQ